MDTFTVAYTCTCGEATQEDFLDNDDSKRILLALVETVVLAGVEDVRIIRHSTDGTDSDETLAVLFALAIATMP